MSSRPLASATCPVPPATDPIGPLTHHAGAELATAHHFAALPSPRRVRSSSVEAARRAWREPTAVRFLAGAPRENAARILIETERLSKFAAIAKSPWRTSPTPAVLRRQRLSVFLEPHARSSTRLRLTTYAKSNVQRLLARSATAIRARSAQWFPHRLEHRFDIFADCEPRVSELLAEAAVRAMALLHAPCCAPRPPHHQDTRCSERIRRVQARKVKPSRKPGA